VSYYGWSHESHPRQRLGYKNPPMQNDPPHRPSRLSTDECTNRAADAMQCWEFNGPPGRRARAAMRPPLAAGTVVPPFQSLFLVFFEGPLEGPGAGTRSGWPPGPGCATRGKDRTLLCRPVPHTVLVSDRQSESGVSPRRPMAQGAMVANYIRYARRCDLRKLCAVDIG
jgi:hypothetical protein